MFFFITADDSVVTTYYKDDVQVKNNKLYPPSVATFMQKILNKDLVI